MCGCEQVSEVQHFFCALPPIRHSHAKKRCCPFFSDISLIFLISPSRSTLISHLSLDALYQIERICRVGGSEDEGDSSWINRSLLSSWTSHSRAQQWDSLLEAV